MIPRLKRKAVVASVIFTCSLVLIYILFSFQVERLPSEEQAAEALRGIELDRNSVPLLKPQEDLKPVEISEAFRKAIPLNDGYWNRKQHSLFQQLNSAVGPDGNAPDEEMDQTPCRPKSVELMRKNIQRFDSYTPIYKDFVRSMHCRDPPILIDQPEKCARMEGEGQPFLLFAIRSLPWSFERRQAVRDTWAQELTYDGGLKVRTVFLLGTYSSEDPNGGALLRLEASRFGDILQWDIKETLHNLTLKDNAFLAWASQRCPGASFVFKGDDDVFVNPWRMIHYMSSLEPRNASRLYVSHIFSNASPYRYHNSKYYMPSTFYKGDYPSYARGCGFLFSGSFIRPLYKVSRHIAFFPIDDVYMGMCFQALGINPVRHPDFKVFGVKAQDKNACVYKRLILVHQHTPQENLWLWRQLLNPLLSC